MSGLDAQLRAFAAHLRDPAAHPPPPGVEPRRMAVYRDLFLNNIRSLLETQFPVARATLGEAAWDALVRDFHARFRSRTPLFPRIGAEFLRFLDQRRSEGAVDPAWLAELAHYERVELDLQLAEAEPPPHDPEGDLLAEIPVRSPLAWALAYRWPVQALAPGRIPATPPEAPTLLLVRRDAHGEVRFSTISPLVHRLLQLLDGPSPPRGRDALARLADEAQATDTGAFLAQGAAMLRRLRAEGSLLGTRPRAPD